MWWLSSRFSHRPNETMISFFDDTLLSETVDALSFEYNLAIILSEVEKLPANSCIIQKPFINGACSHDLFVDPQTRHRSKNVKIILEIRKTNLETNT